jgi:DNA-binding transcriptional LysR family regulator
VGPDSKEAVVELMQLEMFVAVVEEQGVVKAARRVHRTQPAVSLAIGKLEAELGGAVLDRSSRAQGYRPTPMGEIVYEYASRILGLRGELSALVKQEARSAGELRIGASGAAGLARTTELVGMFRERYPEVRIEVLADIAEGVLREILNRKLDVALLSSLPVGAQSKGDLIASQLTSGKTRLWAVERRVGRSHVAQLFVEMLHSAPSGLVVAPHGHERARRMARRTRGLRPALRPAK